MSKWNVDHLVPVSGLPDGISEKGGKINLFIYKYIITYVNIIKTVLN